MADFIRVIMLVSKRVGEVFETIECECFMASSYNFTPSETYREETFVYDVATSKCFSLVIAINISQNTDHYSKRNPLGASVAETKTY